MATIYYGPDPIAGDIEVEFSIQGVKLALAKLLNRAEYRRVFRGYSVKGTCVHVVCRDSGSYAFVATRNDDGSNGPTYTIVE